MTTSDPVTDSDIESALIADFIKTVSGNPKCGRSGCFGRGYTHVVATTDSKMKNAILKVELCTCATVGVNGYARMVEKLDKVTRDIAGLQRLIAEEQSREHALVVNFTFWGGFRYVYLALKAMATHLVAKLRQKTGSQNEPLPNPLPAEQQ